MTALFDEVQALRAELEAVKAGAQLRLNRLIEANDALEASLARAAQLEAENGRLRSVLEPFTYPGATVAGQIGRPEISSVRAARNALTGREG